jgi:hypothetical protein
MFLEEPILPKFTVKQQQLLHSQSTAFQDGSVTQTPGDSEQICAKTRDLGPEDFTFHQVCQPIAEKLNCIQILKDLRSQRVRQSQEKTKRKRILKRFKQIHPTAVQMESDETVKVMQDRDQQLGRLIS